MAGETRKYVATSLTVSSVRSLSAESSVNGAKACDCLNSELPSSRVGVHFAAQCQGSEI